eukprot:TRINITY_DN51863_c0_g1_i1.p1 TRINITY_DN51863_c0_g1~~TRINITY_DN51863_c0_g1_i1.p1  ORF type:complete len:323 (+),score=72.66 TRINITY_DN51863_c0_g1_i1:84-1052(+)
MCIRDSQYADIENATSFSGSETRYYRCGLSVAKEAVACWNARDLKFVGQLGDLIDGQNSGTYGQGVAFKDQPKSDSAFAEVFEELQRCVVPMYHAVGNHELYNFDWEGLSARLNIPGRHKVSEDGEFYFSFSPHPGWTFIMLNPYKVSLMQPKDNAGYEEAEALMLERNPNDVLSGQGNVNYFDGMQGPEMRFVPFNGGLGKDQREWLAQTVRYAAAAGDKIVILTHIPIDHRSSSHKTVLYDAPEVLDILKQQGKGAVVAVLAGHSHSGGYAKDETGCHHVVLRAPLTHQTCYGVMQIFEDRMVLEGIGAQTSFTMSFKDC